MALSCSTSAFKTNLERALTHVRECGFTNADLIAIGGWDHVDAEALISNFNAYSRQIISILDKTGITPVAFNMALGSLNDRSAEAVRKRLDRLEALLRCMNSLSVKVASFYPGYKVPPHEWENAFRSAAESIREMIHLGSRYGVTLAVELHYDTIFQTLEQSIRLLDEIPSLYIALDPSHFAMQNMKMQQLEPLMDRVAHVHLRDAGPGAMQKPFGTGTVDFKWLLNRLKQAHYDGHITVEYLPAEDFDVCESIRKMSDLVKDIFPL